MFEYSRPSHRMRASTLRSWGCRKIAAWPWRKPSTHDHSSNVGAGEGRGAGFAFTGAAGGPDIAQARATTHAHMPKWESRIEILLEALRPHFRFGDGLQSCQTLKWKSPLLHRYCSK